jgi:4-alpha-glucanotransferase
MERTEGKNLRESVQSADVMNLWPEKRIAGVLVPLFALRGQNDLGIGDIAALREFIDWIAGVEFKLVQLLPINETGSDNSPYNAISAMAIEPTTLHLAPESLEDLTNEDFANAMAGVEQWDLRKSGVQYHRVKHLKSALLSIAFWRFDQRRADDPRKRAFQEFCETQESWLSDYTLFRWLMDANTAREKWDRWPPEYATRESTLAWIETQDEAVRDAIAKRRARYSYIQWIAHEQWQDVRAFAEQRGVALMGDIPYGVSYYSADVFARPDEFMLDWFGGAPPEPHFKEDAFTQKWGQNWGIPLYRWDRMRANNFEWWRQRVRAVRRIFHLFRIDHVQGFYRIYAFPWRPQRNKEFLPLDHNQMLKKTEGRAPHFVPCDDETPENCEVNKRDGEEYLRVVLEEACANRVVGEDLGVVPRYVRPSLRAFGIAGFKIPQWETSGGEITPGDKYERLSVATYATHDHKPLRALWEEAFERQTTTSEQSRSELEKIAFFAGLSPKIDPLQLRSAMASKLDFEKDFYPPIMEALFKSNAWIAIVMITDLLARKYRFNVPGTKAKWNWTRRMQRSVAQLRASRKERNRMQLIRELLEKAGRT